MSCYSLHLTVHLSLLQQFAVGAILVQEDDTGVERVIQYVSQSLSTSQRRWSVIEKECFAIVFSINKLRPYLYGARFVIYCDHRPLRGLFTKQMNNTRIQHWAILIAPLKSVALIDSHNDFVDPNAFPCNIPFALQIQSKGRPDTTCQISSETPKDSSSATVIGRPQALIIQLIEYTAHHAGWQLKRTLSVNIYLLVTQS